MKKLCMVICAWFALAACSAGEGAGGAASTNATSSTTSASSGEQTQGLGGGDRSGCELYGPTHFELGEGGNTFLLDVPVECEPYYLEKGRPPESDVKSPDMSVGPEPFLGSESIDVCAE